MTRQNFRRFGRRTRYGVSYRDLEEIMEERGVEVDHAAINRGLSTIPR